MPIYSNERNRGVIKMSTGESVSVSGIDVTKSDDALYDTFNCFAEFKEGSSEEIYLYSSAEIINS